MDEWEAIEEFCEWCCVVCPSYGWHCIPECDFMTKARQYPIERINKRFNECGKNLTKLTLDIMQWK